MGQHIRSPETSHRSGHHARPRALGSHALIVARGNRGTSGRDTVLADREAAGWSALRTEISDSRNKEKDLKNIYTNGLDALVEKGKYHPRVLESIPGARMIPVFESHDDPALEKLDGYMMPGRNTGNFKDTQGRYLALRDLDEAAIALHEVAHVAVNLGDPEEHHVLRESITNQIARDVMNVTGNNSTGLNRLYAPHERLLKQVMGYAQLTAYDVSYFVSGSDPVQNDLNLRQTVYDRVGWDMVGFMQNTYLEGIYSEQNPKHDQYIAARYTQQALDEQIAAMQQPQLV